VRKFLILFAVALSVAAGYARAQQSDVNKEAERQVMKLENEKIAVMLKGGPEAADWFQKIYTDDISYTVGAGFQPKSQTVDEFRSGARKLLSIKHDDYRVRVYNNGNTAILTYRGNDVMQRNGVAGKPELVRTTDVYVKQNGAWKIAVHSVVPQK
jgi:hypothetical protein